MDKFIPELPDHIVYEDVNTLRLFVPEDFSLPETTEQIINRILNTKIASVVTNAEPEENPLDFSLDDDDMSSFPDDFFVDNVGEVFEKPVDVTDPQPAAEQAGSQVVGSEPKGDGESNLPT